MPPAARPSVFSGPLAYSFGVPFCGVYGDTPAFQHPAAGRRHRRPVGHERQPLGKTRVSVSVYVPAADAPVFATVTVYVTV